MGEVWAGLSTGSEGVLAWCVAAAFAASALAPLVHRRWGARGVAGLGVVPLLLAGVYGSLLPGIAGGEAVHVAWAWLPPLGLAWSFFADGLSILFLLIISAIGATIVWYASGYLRGDPHLGRFAMVLLAFMGSMLGIVSADNLLLLFVFWELTSVTSYFLIGHKGESPRAREAALQALLVTGAGGLAMLAGVILLGLGAGTLEISALLAMGSLAHVPGFEVAVALILLGAFTKSAQFPFHFWLPNAMEAPAPVSAFLHSATMVKAGVFLLARLHPCLSSSVVWETVVAPVGAVTMLLGVGMALGQRDLKRILAYTTVAVLGALTMLLGLGTELAVKACMAYILAHALYKAALFMTSGTVDHETGTRDPNALGGLRRAMPWTAAAALVAALSMAGIPFMLGFVSKEYFYKALLDAPGPRGLWEAAGVAASAAMVALAVVVGVKPFVGRLVETPKPAHEGPWSMWLGPLVLGAAAIKFGIFPGRTGELLVGPAAGAVLGAPDFVAGLKLWHGWTVALGLSVLTVVLGGVVYVVSPWLRAAGFPPPRLARYGPEAAYFAVLRGVLAFAGWQTRVLQNGTLRVYILVVLAFTALLVGLSFPYAAFGVDLGRMAVVTPLGAVACVMVAAAAVVACVVGSRFTAIVALGVVGLGVAMLFYLFSGPDLAMTQVLTETLVLVVLVLAFRGLPLLKEYSPLRTRVRDAVVAGVFGAMMAALALLAIDVRGPESDAAQFMGASSLPLAHGRNVVNVILVDFRALDTLGEIAVLAIAALGVMAMLKLKPGSRR